MHQEPSKKIKMDFVFLWLCLFSHFPKIMFVLQAEVKKRQKKAKQTPKIQTEQIETKKVPNGKGSLHLRSASSSISKVYANLEISNKQ